MRIEFFLLDFKLLAMDQRKVTAFLLLANDKELETFCLCFMMVFLMYMYASWHYENNMGIRNRVFVRNETRMSFVNSLLGSDVHSISQLRMDRRTFGILCELLRHDDYIKKDGTVTLEEQVCIFLHILAHHAKNRTIVTRFYRSGETISRYFNSVLNGVLRLHETLLRHPDPVPENCTDDRWKMFKVSL